MQRNRSNQPIYRLTQSVLHIDWTLFSLLLLMIALGMVILYSASNENMGMVLKQGFRILGALLIMLMLAMVPPHRYKIWTPWLYGLGLFLLVAVMVMGKIGKGAQRWLDLGIFRFQPSEIMKLAVPMMAAWYIDRIARPLKPQDLLSLGLLIFIPGLLIAKQPDLGTAILVISAGLVVVFLGGLSLKLLSGLMIAIAGALPLLWHVMHDYQKKRIYTLINPEADPLGSGYHIIQSKIAIGSGGVSGKGWLMGTQSHLNFLPEHATDFIFAVCGEELGLFGCLAVIALVIAISLYGLKIALEAQTTYTRLLAASLIMSFFISAFVNMGMVMGILPVVGIPLPLVSYGGTAMVTFLASFGVIMSVSTHRILFNSI